MDWDLDFRVVGQGWRSLQEVGGSVFHSLFEHSKLRPSCKGEALPKLQRAKREKC